jgi:hypothetical protein
MTQQHFPASTSPPAPIDFHLRLEINGTTYAVDPLAADALAAPRAYRLTKPDGTTYQLRRDRVGFVECSCPDARYRGQNCKHKRALTTCRVL